MNYKTYLITILLSTLLIVFVHQLTIYFWTAQEQDVRQNAYKTLLKTAQITPLPRTEVAYKKKQTPAPTPTLTYTPTKLPTATATIRPVTPTPTGGSL